MERQYLYSTDSKRPQKYTINKKVLPY